MNASFDFNNDDTLSSNSSEDMDDNDVASIFEKLMAMHGPGAPAAAAAAAPTATSGCHAPLVLETLEYGAGTTWIDVLPEVLRRVQANELRPVFRTGGGGGEVARPVNTDACVLWIPTLDDDRCVFFQSGDPVPGVRKSVRVNGTLTFPAFGEYMLVLDFRDTDHPVLFVYMDARVTRNLRDLHDTFNPRDGCKDMLDLNEELPEQKILHLFLSGAADPSPSQEHPPRVLELGGHLGRASLVTSALLAHTYPVSSSVAHVVMESDADTAKELEVVRAVNNGAFTIVPATLNDATRWTLSQHNWVVSASARGANTGASGNDTGPASVDYDHLCRTHFHGRGANVWVVDCEGFFLHVLRVYPQVLQPDHMQLLVLENDFRNSDDKAEVDALLHAAGMRCVLSWPGGFPGVHPCRLDFYQVWIRAAAIATSPFLSSIMSSVFNPHAPASDLPPLVVVGGVVGGAPPHPAVNREEDIVAKALDPTMPVVKSWRGCGEGEAGAEAGTLHNIYDILSLPTCSRCEDLFGDMMSSVLTSGATCANSQILIRKRDASTAFRTDRAAAIACLQTLGACTSCTTPSSPMGFPLIFHNGRFLGGIAQTHGHLAKLLADMEDQDQDVIDDAAAAAF